MRSCSRGNERTDVAVWIIAFAFREQNLAGHDGVKNFTHSKVGTHCSLALEHLQASDRQTKCSSHWINDSLEGIEIRDRCEQLGTTETPGHQLTVRNTDVENAVLLEEIEDEWNASSLVRVSGKTPT